MPHASLRISFDTLVRNERAQLLALLIKQLGDIELAEDALQDAFIKAWQQWQHSTLPDNPKSWLLKVAYNHAIDVIRRRQNFNSKQPQISHLIELQHTLGEHMDDELIADERLKLIFTCCHPALDNASQVALTLSTVCGFSTAQVATAFLLKLPTMAQRLVRAKRKIKVSGIPYKTPEKADLAARLSNVLSVIYLIYNQGYYAAENTELTNLDQSEEAMRLAKTLNQLMPDQAELLGLMALMNFHQARFDARHQQSNQLISLEQQDRRLWRQDLITSAQKKFTQAIALKNMGPYQIQAAISGVHSQAESFAATDWQQIVLLYQKLYEYLPLTTVKINQAVAMAYNQQLEAAWSLLQSVEQDKMSDYLPFYLAQAHVKKLMNQKSEACNFFSLAMALSKNHQERDFLQNQIDLLKD